MHNHIKPKQCKHVFQFCSECSVVYCDKCKKEWKEEVISVTSVWPKQAPWQDRFPEVTWGDPFNNPNKITYIAAHQH